MIASLLQPRCFEIINRRGIRHFPALFGAPPAAGLAGAGRRLSSLLLLALREDEEEVPVLVEGELVVHLQVLADGGYGSLHHLRAQPTPANRGLTQDLLEW